LVETNGYDISYLEHDLTNCKLCSWECGVDRIAGDIGVCGITVPEVASSQLHPAPPASYDAFMTGCSFRCLFCQNWAISTYPTNPSNLVEGYYDPKGWAEMALAFLASPEARMMGADRLFFTGGEPSCSLPWVEEVVREARRIDSTIKVNFDTNGFVPPKTFDRILSVSTSITFDIKAFHPEVFSALTGAFVEPVLKRAKNLASTAPEKLWEFRVMVISGIHEHEVEDLCDFLADIGPDLPVNFLAFRPNFIMEDCPGATRALLEHCVSLGKRAGLTNVSWSGRAGIEATIPEGIKGREKELEGSPGERLAMAFAKERGCISNRRNCGKCKAVHECILKRYEPAERW